MSSYLFDLSHTAKPAQIQENMIVYMRLFAGLPGMGMRDDAQMFWFVSGRGAPGDNILRARWPDERADEGIDEILAQVARHADEMSWMVFPGDRPVDLNERLEARGMPGGPGGFWLWADLSTLGPAPAVPDGFHIKRVADDRGMAEWVKVSEAGFGGDLACFYDAYARHCYGLNAFSLHYTGYLGDTPVTSGTLLDAGGTAAIYDLSTPPEYRRLGLGGALTHSLLHEIRRRGYTDTWIWSSGMARSLYQKLGFIDADFGVREHTWRKEIVMKLGAFSISLAVKDIRASQVFSLDGFDDAQRLRIIKTCTYIRSITAVANPEVGRSVAPSISRSRS